MIKTYNDLILACDNFGYSKEYYEMMKEAAEIDLMNIYVANQEYMAENTDLIMESADVLEDYFQEAIDTNNIKNVVKTAATKTVNLAKKVWSKILMVLKAIGNFLKRFGMNMKSRYDTIVRGKVMLDSMKNMPDEAIRILEKYNSQLKEVYDNYNIISDEGQDLPKPLASLKALISGKMKVRTVKDATPTTPSNLSKLLKYIGKDNKRAKALLEKIKESEITPVTVVKGSLQRDLEDINDAINTVQDMMDVANSNLWDSKDKEDEKAAKKHTDARDCIELLNDAMKVASDTLKLYTFVDKNTAVMDKMCKELSEALKDNKKNAKAAKKQTSKRADSSEEKSDEE